MKVKITISVVLLFSVWSSNVFSQTYIQPNYALKSHKTLEISKVEIAIEKTTFYLTIENRMEGGTFCADRNIWLVYSDGERLKLENASGIPVCPDSFRFKSIGEKLQFTLAFPPIKAGTKWVDIIEECTDNCFSFYGVTLNADLNSKIDEAISLVESGRKTVALALYKNIIENLGPSDQGIKGALYSDIITLSLETEDKQGAREWYSKMLSSDVPHLQLFVKNLNSRGIKF